MEYAIPIALSANDAGIPDAFIKADPIVIGDRHACYRDAGVVYCFGQNLSGNLGNRTTTWEPYPVAVSLVNGMPTTVDSLQAGCDLSPVTFTPRP